MFRRSLMYVAPSVNKQFAQNYHTYKIKVPMFKSKYDVTKIGKEFLSKPEKYFPLKASGTFTKNETLTLEYMYTKNPVEVEEITETTTTASVKLKAKKEHFFQGWAKHTISKDESNNVCYEVEGEGPADEPKVKEILNNLFGNNVWPKLIQDRTKPALEESFKEKDE